MTKVAAIQMASGPNVGANLSEVERLVSKAVKDGAKLVVLPENFAFMGMSEKDVLDVAEEFGKGQIQDAISTLARKHKLWIMAGTIPIVGEKANKVRAAALLFNEQGEVVCRYDKIHLFDVDLGDDGGSYNESAFYEPGGKVEVCDTPFGKIGMAVCYDLRFPEIFRVMVDKGMEVVLVASSFTSVTGNAHWEVLNRARAIENLCYVVSAAQGGYHVNGRETHGHTMILDPWGGVKDELTRGSGYVVADIDLASLTRTRKNFPVLAHRAVSKIKCSSSGDL